MMNKRLVAFLLCALAWSGAGSPAYAQPSAISVSIPDAKLFQDSFPQNSSIDVSTQASRDALDIRVDSATDAMVGPGVLSIDGVQGVAISGTAGTDIASVRLVWSLTMNPLFEDSIRPNAPVTDAGAGLRGWDQSEGFIEIFPVVPTSTFLFELDVPDTNFMYPGDVLEYYFRVTDSNGWWYNYPANTAGYDDTTMDYDSRFVVRGLPGIVTALGAQPQTLFVNNNGHGLHEGPYKLAMANNGFVLGVDYDMYTVNAPDQGEPNGIGSAGSHGASWQQLNGYTDIIFATGTRTSYLLNDGSGNGGNTESDDIGVLRTWQLNSINQGRDIALFGENLPCFLASGSLAAQDWLANHMGVTCVSTDVRPAIGGANAPSVTPVSPSFVIGPFAVGGVGNHPFDEIDPIGPLASTAHIFSGFPNESASVQHEWLVQGNNTVVLTFAFDLESPFEIMRATIQTTASKLLLEALVLMKVDLPAGPPVSAPTNPGRALQQVSARPNPFNPATSIVFSLSRSGPVTLRIYTIRGELVREFVPKVFQQGRSEIRWDGTDQAGRVVASGVYVAEIAGGGEVARQKLALVK